ncbi:hypothetical protein Y032_0862g2741 [Ancylostoma ceylanicum]|uniref:Uncharacterized protein n=1 Tax=Ancylostoma ceylanicum TaxID=53326 RepID=A0A016WBQ6_9BILA|nr:hypothetical protein Y032_0862g2741 [Ancylostoma ceylanicum]
MKKVIIRWCYIGAIRWMRPQLLVQVLDLFCECSRIFTFALNVFLPISEILKDQEMTAGSDNNDGRKSTHMSPQRQLATLKRELFRRNNHQNPSEFSYIPTGYVLL